MHPQRLAHLARTTVYWRSRWAIKKARRARVLLGRRWARERGAHGKAMAKAAKAKRQAPPLTVVTPTQMQLAAAQSRVREAARSAGPVIAGPWLGPVGFELLYWMPFLAWAIKRRPEIADRLYVVSRGGAEPWYEHLTDRYADAFELMTPGQIAIGRGLHQNPVEVSDLERELLSRAAERFGLERYTVLHPSTWYAVMHGLLKQDALPALTKISRHCRLESPAHRTLSFELPEDYVAARFSFTDAFADTPANRVFAADVVRRLASQTHVVLLDRGLRADVFEGLASDSSGRILCIDEHVNDHLNLAAQSEVIAGAQAYVGSYGGLSYLPPLYGVASLSFYSDAAKFTSPHIKIAQGIYSQLGTSAYITLHTSQLGVVNLLAESKSVSS